MDLTKLVAMYINLNEIAAQMDDSAEKELRKRCFSECVDFLAIAESLRRGYLTTRMRGRA